MSDKEDTNTYLGFGLQYIFSVLRCERFDRLLLVLRDALENMLPDARIH